ncbi:unnamed protein product [Bursaphelenchus xylophilus]|uniref:(pine wood nematode) hypothetical protein n=1 Tax=Bursaphelenchus xylophilus TaxID=6326 RepID=A0A1I7S1J0_BURXY|nr:unnamed protein product [Bursaphelenchus xylophilus]CAG9081427.1 unnamed protein product [Bursaphelenchus xylophilus]
MTVFLWLLVGFGAATTLSDLFQDNKIYGRLMKPISPDHREGIKEVIKCVAQEFNLTEEAVVDVIQENSETHKGAFAYVESLDDDEVLDCFQNSTDLYVVAAGNLIKIWKEREKDFTKVTDRVIVDGQKQTLEDILDRLSTAPKDSSLYYACDDIEKRDPEGEAFAQFYVVFSYVAEELFPGTAYKPTRLIDRVNEKLFTAEGVEPEKLITSCDREKPPNQIIDFF